MHRSLSLFLFVLLLLCCTAGCASQRAEAPVPEAAPEDQTEAVLPEEDEGGAEEDFYLEPGAGLPDSEFEQAEDPAAPEEQGPAPDSGPAVPSSRPGRLVVIDPGHQARANTQQEPVGPGASEMKMKVSGGTAGTATGVPEYELVLTVSLLLRDELEARGYEVLLVRETNDVDISNRERAEIANSAGADVFLRIHANGSEDRGANGAMTLCPTPDNPYPIGALYPQCRLLSDCVLDELTAATGINKQRVWETDTMSGINWCQVPVTLVEMGYMSNPEEDARLNDPACQAMIVQGIANGVDAYFSRQAG